ncbi:DDT domain-containing protein [Trichoplax sp. H2]|nr:DDT domain-containing protein [Trichoplax sp. H2]|eukprot:RDD44608.1 DDT domain-containing protein [Trichoplax sp. H2]
MPLLKGNQWQPKVKLSKSLDRNCELFVIRFTNEAFQSIDKYYERLDLYRSRCWTCSVTGKNKLTYEEALLSEKMGKSRKRISKQTPKKKRELGVKPLSRSNSLNLPKEFAVPVLTKVQFSTKNLKEIIDDLRDYLIKKAKSNRVNGLPSKATLKSFICKTTKRYRYRNSPFIVKKAYIKKFNLTVKEMPKKLVSAHQDYLRKQRKSINDSAKRKANSEPGKKSKKIKTKNATKSRSKQMSGSNKNKRKDDKAKKIKRLKSGKDDAKSKVKKKKSNGNKEKKEKNKRDKSKSKIKEKKVVIVDWPIPSRDSDPLPQILGDLLMSWKFLNTFSKCIKLYPFPFDHLQLAFAQTDLTNGSPLCDLIVHSFSCLLSILFDEVPDNFQSKENLRNYRVINNHNWERAVVVYLQGMRESGITVDIPESIQYLVNNNCNRFSFSFSAFEARVQLLRVLIDLVLESVTIRQCLEDAVGDLHDLKRSWRVEKADVMKKIKENKSVNNLADSTESQINESSTPESTDDKENQMTENESKPVSVVDRAFEEQQLKRKETRFLNATSIQVSFLRHPFIGRDSSNRRYWGFDGSFPIGKLYVEDENGQWMYYCTPKELETLIMHLKSKGLKNENEKELYNNLIRDKDNLSAIMQKQIDDIRKLTECRHSARLQSILREKPYLGYENKYANQ